MATVNVILDKRNKDVNLIDSIKGTDENIYPLKLRIFHGDLYRDIHLNHSIKISEWVDKKITKSYPNSARTNSGIQQRLSIATTFLSEYDQIIAPLHIDAIRELVSKEIEKQINSKIDESTKELIKNSLTTQEGELWLEKFGEILTERKRKKKKNGTANWYADGIRAVKKFNGDRDIRIADISVSFLEDFEAEQLSKGNGKNAISAYLRAVRSICNSAVKEILKGERYKGYPWGSGGYSIPSEKTKKRAVKKDVIVDIRNLSVEKKIKEKYKKLQKEGKVKGSQENSITLKKELTALLDAKNYFLFMFNNRGMNLIDVAKFKKSQITQAKYENNQIIEGRLDYNRSKSGRDFSIKLTKESLEILNYYMVAEKSDNDFVFPIGYEESEKGVAAYSQKRKRINRRFRELAAMIGQTELNVTTYVVRHSWATIAKKDARLSTEIISEGLGHEDTKTTATYLEEFEHDVLDEANELIVA